MLADAQIERYSRQIILPQVGGRGQEKILQSRVYVDGDGLLATAALFYLAAAGVGTLGVARATAAPLFSVLAAHPLGAAEQPVTHTLRRLNPECTVVTHADEDAQPPRPYDLMLATTDALHDAWYARHKPFVWGAASGADARVFVSRGDRADRPCLRCLFSQNPPDSPARSPEEPHYAFFLGTQLVTEALKILLQIEADRPPKLLQYQFPAFHCTEQTVEKNPHCPACSPRAHD